MAESPKSFHDMLEILGISKAPLSVRMDEDYRPTSDELQLARRTVGHVMADAELRGRLASLKVEPLVRAAAILLDDAKRGKAPRAMREVAESVAAYLDVLARAFGDVPSVLNNRGVAQSLLGDSARADADLAAARRLAPNFVAPRVNEIAVLRERRDFVRLERVAEEVEKLDPGSLEAMRAGLDAKVELKRPPEDILAAASRLHAAKGARPADLLRLADLSMGLADLAKAEGYLRELVGADPRSVEGHVRLADVFLKSKKFPEAVGVYEKLTEIDGPKHEYLLAIAMVYDQMGRVHDAENAFDFALEHASARDQETIEQAYGDFKKRRGAQPATLTPEPMPAKPAAPAPTALAGPLPAEEADLPDAAHDAREKARGTEPAVQAPDPDLSGEAFEPKAIGDVDLRGITTKEVPIAPAAPPAEPPEPAGPIPLDRYFDTAPAPKVEAPAGSGAPALPEATPPARPPAPPPAPGPAPQAEPKSTEERIAEALESSTAGTEGEDDIMGEGPSQAQPREPPHLEPSEPPEAAPAETQAIVVAKSESIVAAPAPPPAERSAEPVVSTPAPSAPPEPVIPGEELAAKSTAPVVSAPPPERPDEALTAELEALAASAGEPEVEAPKEPEPFKRPTFDVDAFMAALEAKTKPTFDHLYDGMLEARRKDAADGQARARGPSPYESAPPSERLSVQAGPAPPPAAPPAAEPSAAAPAAPGPAPERAPEQAPEQAPSSASAMPALFHGQAKEAIAQSAREAHVPDASLFSKAEDRAKAGDDGGAESALDAYLRDFPDDGHGWNLKGDLRERAGDETGAVRSYWQAVKYAPDLKEAWNNLGVLLHLGGRFSDAASAFESAVKAAPDDRHLWHNLGSTYHELGRLEDAIAAFDRALAIDPADKVSYNNKGTTLFELGDFKGARACFQKAAALDPGFEQALNNLGRALEKLDDKEGAVQSFEAALERNALSGTALKNLARVLRDLGRAGEAQAAEARLRALGT